MPPENRRSARKRSAAHISSSPSPSLDSGAPASKLRRTRQHEAPTDNQGGSGSSSNSGSNDNRSSRTAPIDVELVDLTEDGSALQETLQKQRAEQVKAQAPPTDHPPTLSSFTCVICMDTPTDLTATSCGHLFCHSCLIAALKAGEARRRPGEAKRSQCPVCRKILDRNKATDVIPLLIRKAPREALTPK